MTTSDLKNVKFRQEHFAAGSVIFSTNERVDSSEPFFEVVPLESFAPFAEKTRVYITPVSSPVTDGDIFYGGNYKPSIDDIIILNTTNQALNTSMRNSILEQITINESQDSGGTDLFELNITPLANSGIQFFSIRIPYKEQDVVNNSVATNVTFLEFLTDTSGEQSKVNATARTSEEKFIITADSQFITEPVMAINDISSARQFESKTAEIVLGSIDNLVISYSEFLSTRTLLSIDETLNIPFSSNVGINFNFNAKLTENGGTGNGSIDLTVAKKFASLENNILVDDFIFNIETAYGLTVTTKVTESISSKNFELEISQPNIGSNDKRYILPCIVFKKDNSSSVTSNPLNIIIGPMQITLYADDKQDNPVTHEVFFAVDADDTVSDIIDKMNTAISTVPEWNGFWKAGLFTGTHSIQFSSFTGGNSTTYDFTEEFWEGATFGTNDVLADNRGIIQRQYKITNFPPDFITQINDIAWSSRSRPSLLQFNGSAIALYWRAGTSGVKDNYNLDITNLDNKISDLLLFIKNSCSASFYPSSLNVTTTGFNILPDEYLNLPARVLKNKNTSWHNSRTQSFVGSLVGPIIEIGSFVHKVESLILAGDVYQTFNISVDFISVSTIQDLSDAINLALDLETLSEVEAFPGPSFSEQPVSLLNRTENIIIDSMLKLSSIADTFVVFKGSLGDTFTDTESFSLTGNTINDIINSINNRFVGLFEAELLLSGIGGTQASLFSEGGPHSVEKTNNQAIFLATFEVPVSETYEYSFFPTLQSLANIINTDWVEYGITANVVVDTDLFPDAITKNLNETNAILIRDNPSVVNREIFGGSVFETPTPEAPVENVELSFNIKFARGGEPTDGAGIQVALGGYESEGTFFPNNSPNTFFETGFNTIFPITFDVIDADIIYLLVRTRKNLDGSIFVSESADYAGISTYNNGFPTQQLIPTILTANKFSSVWTETDLGDPPSSQVPTVLTVKGGRSSFIDVSIEDVLESDAVNVSIFNSPDTIDDFAFLAINRSNLQGSMIESRGGRAFGLVLDNRGIWDVLIGPEAELAKIDNGQFSYLNSQYERTTLDSDEAWDFEFNDLSGIPESVQNSISLIPVPGYPQVWSLRIEKGVKNYLASLRQGASRTSQQGCSIDIDMLVTGRTSGVQGTCRITIYYDVYCVFDVDLCDAFWNLKDPIEPVGPEIIENILRFSYQSLVDCSNLEQVPDGDNTEFNVPVLTTISNVPMFENGNALLLLKSTYTSEVQGFYYPINNNLSNMQFPTVGCPSVGENVPLLTRLNKTAIYIPGQEEAITDPFLISDTLENGEAYMYVKPVFQFPNSDPEKDCSPEEIVIIGIGYQFKNWSSGFREEIFLFGTNLVLPSGVFSIPELDLCYKYYYNREES